MAPASFVDGSKSVFAYENRYIEDDACEGRPHRQPSSPNSTVQKPLSNRAASYGDEAAVKIPPRRRHLQDRKRPRRIQRHGTIPPHLRRPLPVPVRVDGKPITENDQYRALRNCTPAEHERTAQYRPAALLFGAWDSTRKEQPGPPAQRLVGEIIGVLGRPGSPALNTDRHAVAAPASMPSLLVCSLPLRTWSPWLMTRKLNWSPGNVGARRNEIKKAKADARISASPLGLGGIPPVLEETGAVACCRIIRSWVLSLATFRQLRFGTDEKERCCVWLTCPHSASTPLPVRA